VKIKNVVVVVVYLVQKCFPKNLKEGDCVTRTEKARRRKKDYKEPQDNIYIDNQVKKYLYYVIV
jgi:hypothetical protein